MMSNLYSRDLFFAVAQGGAPGECNSGTLQGGGGSGGRIAVHANYLTYVGKMQAFGGRPIYGASRYVGAAGTIYTEIGDPTKPTVLSARVRSMSANNNGYAPVLGMFSAMTDVGALAYELDVLELIGYATFGGIKGDPLPNKLTTITLKFFTGDKTGNIFVAPDISLIILGGNRSSRLSFTNTSVTAESNHKEITSATNLYKRADMTIDSVNFYVSSGGTLVLPNTITFADITAVIAGTLDGAEHLILQGAADFRLETTAKSISSLMTGTMYFIDITVRNTSKLRLAATPTITITLRTSSFVTFADTSQLLWSGKAYINAGGAVSIATGVVWNGQYGGWPQETLEPGCVVYPGQSGQGYAAGGAHGGHSVQGWGNDFVTSYPCGSYRNPDQCGNGASSAFVRCSVYFIYLCSLC
jgi:hypothetical protein